MLTPSKSYAVETCTAPGQSTVYSSQFTIYSLKAGDAAAY